MPKAKVPRKPTLAATLRKELRDKRKSLSKQLSHVIRDLHSIGVKHVKKKASHVKG